MPIQPEPISITEDEEFTILIDWWGPRGGVQKAARGETLQAMQEQSQKALNMAMDTIRGMAYRIAKTINTLEDKVRPDEAEVEFGIKLDAEAGALLTKARAEAQLTVKLKWTIEQPDRAKVLVSQ